MFSVIVFLVLYVFVPRSLVLKVLCLGFALLVYLKTVFFVLHFFDFLYWYEGVVFFSLENRFTFFSFFDYTLSFDGLSVLLLFFTSFLFLVSLLVIWQSEHFFDYFNLLFALFFFLFQVFVVDNLFWFYVFFEATLVPMYILIGFFGSRSRKITASYRFFLYTFIGSIFFFSVLFFLFFSYGTLHLYKLFVMLNISGLLTKVFWFFFFVSFAVKMPLYPFHTWLPEAHSEAPTVGSIILAGILLKLGPYGLVKFANLLFIEGLYFFRPIIFIFCFLGLYYTAASAIRQLDIKRIVAYSSIGHMSLVMLGLLAFNFEGYLGSFLLLLAHGFVSGGLFLTVGFIYERYYTRNLLYFGRLVQLNPLLSVFMFFFVLANFAFPGTMNFVSEVYILLGVFKMNFFVCFFSVISSMFVLAYNLFLYSRLFYGSEIVFSYSRDLFFRDLVVAFLFLLPVFLFGVLPSFFYVLLDKTVYFFLGGVA